MNAQLLNNVSHDIIEIVDIPSKKLNFISVTGSNEKDSVTKLLRKILQYLGRSVKIEDTIKNISLMKFNTTSLDYHRVNMYDFDIGIFTDLSENQFDMYTDILNCEKAILQLFNVCEIGLLNYDDEHLRKIMNTWDFNYITYAINNSADFIAKDIRYSQQGINFNLYFHGSEKSVHLNTFNKSNIYNVLAAIGTCYFLGFPLNLTIEALNHIKMFN